MNEIAPKQEKKQNPEVTEFTKRLTGIDLHIDTSVFEHSSLTDDTPADLGHTDQVLFQNETGGNIEKLATQQNALKSKLFEKNTSPLFNTEGKRIGLRNLNELFFKSLVEKGFSLRQAHYIEDVHVQPAADVIRGLSDIAPERLEGEELEDNPFGALQTLQKEDDVKSEIRKVRDQAWVRYFHLLHNIYTTPENFDISLGDESTEGKPTIAVEDFMLSLGSKSFQEAFVLEGSLLSTGQMSSLCREVISGNFEEKYGAVATQLLMKKCVYPIIHNMSDVYKSKNIQSEKSAALKKLSGTLAMFMHDLLDPGNEDDERDSGIIRYGNLVAYGKYSNNNAVDFPVLWLRQSAHLKSELGKKRHPKEVYDLKMEYYLDTVVSENYSNERQEELAAMVLRGDIESSDEFAQENDTLFGLDIDEVGDKPKELIAAEALFLLQKAGYSDDEAQKELAGFFPNFVQSLLQLREERYVTLQEHEERSTQVRAVNKRLDNTAIEFVKRLKQCLQDPTTMKILSGGNDVKLLTRSLQ